MTTAKHFICQQCKHYDPFKFGCKAFPTIESGGIPDDVLTGENDHSKPFPDQINNLVFEKKMTESEHQPN